VTKPLWKVTFTCLSIHLLPLYALTRHKPHSWSKVYRWKWRAKLAAAQFPSMGGIYIATKIEAYWPDCDNVVSLRAA
jgi:hypothetical protein